MRELHDLQGWGKKRLALLESRDIVRSSQLLYTLPSGYQDTSQLTPIDQMTEEGRSYAFEGTVITGPSLHRVRGMQWVSATIFDESAKIRVMWFNQPWMKAQLAGEQHVVLYGLLTRKKSGLIVVNPSIVKERAILPVYRSIAGIPGKLMKDTIRLLLDEYDEEEDMPLELMEQYGLCSKKFALRQIHFPEDTDSLQRAKYRLAFEELLYYQASLTGLISQRPNGIQIGCEERDEEDFFDSLRFAPTGAQRRVMKQIACDLRSPVAMARMVQGDVGCGKTLIAFGALVLCVNAGFQGALMAPTEILAGQHLQSAMEMLRPLGITCGLLTGKLTAAQKRLAKEAIESGEWQVVIGTHALISEGVNFKCLGLVITDEQHRFGVRQRTNLALKGEQPNVLVMSATPIPRSLALVLYGDLDISVVDEMPPGRKTVTTRIVPEEKREGMYAFIRAEASCGRQTYIVCPLVGDSDAEGMEEMKSAQTLFEELKSSHLKQLRIGLVHGRMKAQDKDDTLGEFRQGALDVLVSTTVIEVGVNVPNATIMVIEDAHRFGLAQLHQLRGRVGRGAQESWCFLLSKPNERLKTLCQTNDGFVIAQKDLELRGSGEFFGTRQSGDPQMPALMLAGESKILERTQEAWHMLRNDETKHNLAQEVLLAAQKRYDQCGKEVARN